MMIATSDRRGMFLSLKTRGRFSRNGSSAETTRRILKLRKCYQPRRWRIRILRRRPVSSFPDFRNFKCYAWRLATLEIVQTFRLALHSEKRSFMMSCIFPPRYSPRWHFRLQSYSRELAFSPEVVFTQHIGLKVFMGQ